MYDRFRLANENAVGGGRGIGLGEEGFESTSARAAERSKAPSGV